MKRRYLLLFALLCLHGGVQAAPWETLPPDHWAYSEIRWLQVMGYLGDLDPSQQPYTRGQIAAALQTGKEPPAGLVRRRFELLTREFTAEMTDAGEWEFFTGVRTFAGLEASHGQEGREAGYGVIDVGIGKSRIGAYTALRADRDLGENEMYRGKLWSDLAGLTEAAYLTIVGGRWQLKAGRDHVIWGPGEDHLLLNHAARGLDQLYFRVHWRWGNFTALVGQVDDYEDSSGVRTSRFLSGHRLELVPYDWLRIGVSETLLFTGGIRFGSMNPLLPYYGELVNENSEGNGFLGMDVSAFPAAGFQVYGELLLDDVQVEEKSPEDLEPAEWGWLIGGRWAGLNGALAAGVSYEGITNRTYNAIEPRYRYQNHGLPLGSQLGNDGDLLRLDLLCWPDARLRLNGFWEYRRQGEGRVDAPFDRSYLNYTLQEGYSEPFPSGIVQKTTTLGLGMSTLFHPSLQLEGFIGYDWVKNAGNILEAKEEGVRGRVTVNFWLEHVIAY